MFLQRVQEQAGEKWFRVDVCLPVMKKRILQVVIIWESLWVAACEGVLEEMGDGFAYSPSFKFGLFQTELDVPALENTL